MLLITTIAVVASDRADKSLRRWIMEPDNKSGFFVDEACADGKELQLLRLYLTGIPMVNGNAPSVIWGAHWASFIYDNLHTLIALAEKDGQQLDFAVRKRSNDPE